jgi:uncharacterized repeat protein (TIGR03803 family)
MGGFRVSSAFLCVLVMLCGSLRGFAQTEEVIHAFNNTDGGQPLSNLIYDPASDAFYGTTFIGGTNNSGTAFQLKEGPPGTWTETVLYNFLGPFPANDGANPHYGVLPVRTNGVISALYGTCVWGGQYNAGAIFKLTPQQDGTWAENVLHSFGSIAGDGGNPMGGLVMDKRGALYGTTQGGGTGGGGTVFQLKQQGEIWNEHVLYNFNVPAFPEGHLVFDKSGALYGSTASDGPTFSGTVFQLVPPQTGNDWTYNLLYTFTGQNMDGGDPRGGLIFDDKGSLYGTTERGGIAGLGTVFRLDPPLPGHTTWTETQLYRFKDVASDGASPVTGLIFDKNGALYGTTSAGGTFYGGTVFKLTPKPTEPWRKKILWSFGGPGDGSGPWAPLMMKAGALYGTTLGGGTYSEGVVYRITP